MMEHIWICVFLAYAQKTTQFCPLINKHCREIFCTTHHAVNKVLFFFKISILLISYGIFTDISPTHMHTQSSSGQWTEHGLMLCICIVVQVWVLSLRVPLKWW